MGLATYIQFVGALVFVLALIGIGALLLRRFGPGYIGRIGARNRRLAISEVLALDARRRLVLIRRDGVEHLLLLGPSSETVVETAIVPTSFATELDRQRSPAALSPVRLEGEA